MKKYRIVEVREPKLNMGNGITPEWVPFIEHETYYKIQLRINFLWGLFGFWRDTKFTYNKIERAEAQIEFALTPEPKQKVIKTYYC